MHPRDVAVFGDNAAVMGDRSHIAAKEIGEMACPIRLA